MIPDTAVVAELTIVTVGATVYPTPALVINISLTEYELPIEVVIATAVALSSGNPVGEVDIETIGGIV